MKKLVLATVEDYLELIAGRYSSQFGNVTSISLARYDIAIVASMANQTTNGVPFTDRQAELAYKIVVKYKRQLATHGIELGTIEHQPVYRLPVRAIDRVKKISLDGNRVAIKFPYDTDIIDYIRSSLKTVFGELLFDKKDRVWKGSLTEARLLWLEQLADKYQFEIEESVKNLIQQVHACELVPYEIKLTELDCDNFTVTNAENSLIDYIVQHLGGLSKSNAIKLIDHSAVLGYKVEPDLYNKYIGHLDPAVQMLLRHKEMHIPISGINELEVLLKYMDVSGRGPVFLYDPQCTNLESSPWIPMLKEIFGSDLMVVSPRQKKLELDKQRCVYFNNWNPGWKRTIPLLLTFTALMVGTKKQQIIQCSNKVVYCTNVVYNSLSSTVE